MRQRMEMLLYHKIIDREQELQALVDAGSLKYFDITFCHQDTSCDIHLEVKLGFRPIQSVNLGDILEKGGVRHSDILNAMYS